MDLNAIETGFARADGGVRKPLDGFGDLVVVHRVRHPVSTGTPVEGQLFSRGLNGGRAARIGAIRVALRERAGMHQLGDYPCSTRTTGAQASRCALSDRPGWWR